jgi:hypothetical protein
MVQYAYSKEERVEEVKVMETVGPWPMRIETRDNGRLVVASLDYFSPTGKKKGHAFYVATRHSVDPGGENETVADICIAKDAFGQPKRIIRECLDALNKIEPDVRSIAVAELFGEARGQDRADLYNSDHLAGASWSERYNRGWREGRSHKYNPNRSKLEKSDDE